MTRPRSAVRRALLLHLVTSLVVLVVAGLGAVVCVQRVVAGEVERNAVAESRLVAHEVFAPLVTDGVRAGDPRALAVLDRAVRSRTHGSLLLRVKIWDQQGRVLYSDASALIGKRFPLEDDDLAVLRTQGSESNVSDVSRPENVFERGLAPVIEVYVGVRDAADRPAVVEIYFSAANMHRQEVELSTRLTLVSLLALAFLALLLVPLSLRLARRVERYERERLAMLRLAVDASADERRRLARELHDGVVQDLSGTRYVLASVEKQLADSDLPELRGTVRIALDVILVQIEALRSLTSTLFSPNPAGTDVTEVLAGLGRDAEARGLKVRLDIGPLPPLPATVAESLTQVAREALRNVVSHAGASGATVSLTASGDEVTLVIADDGCGFHPERAHTVPLGHLGLQLLQASAQRARGSLTIDSQIGRGTQVRLVIPVRRGEPDLADLWPGAEPSPAEELTAAAAGSRSG
ncbi:MAG: two-component system, NarL family, sensor kinase [Actinomycetota bacterium]|nr:two-component system, NarL family, sensor kinase [Actinomycetota bacterium]